MRVAGLPSAEVTFHSNLRHTDRPIAASHLPVRFLVLFQLYVSRAKLDARTTERASDRPTGRPTARPTDRTTELSGRQNGPARRVGCYLARPRESLVKLGATTPSERASLYRFAQTRCARW